MPPSQPQPALADEFDSKRYLRVSPPPTLRTFPLLPASRSYTSNVESSQIIWTLQIENPLIKVDPMTIEIGFALIIYFLCIDRSLNAHQANP